MILLRYLVAIALIAYGVAYEGGMGPDIGERGQSALMLLVLGWVVGMAAEADSRAKSSERE